MSNFKKKEFYNVITGDEVDKKYYGLMAEIYRRADNIDMIYDSRGNYLGLRVSMGQVVDKKLTFSKGPFYFESIDDLMIWAGMRCSEYETKDNKLIIIGEVKG